MSLNVWLVMLHYLFIFAVCVALVPFVFKTSYITALYCGTGAYALQHLAYRVGYIATELCFAYMAVDYSTTGHICYSIADVVCFAVFLVCSLLWLRNIEERAWKNKRIIFICLATLVIVTGLSTVFTRYSTGTDIVIKAVSVVYVIACCVFILLYLTVLTRNAALASEARTLEKIVDEQGEQYTMSKANIEIINIKCHDLKKQIAALEERVPEEDLEELKNAISIYEANVHSGNEVLDTVVTDRLLASRDDKVKLLLVADGELLSFMKDSDIYSLFGNAMDNAIRAVKSLPVEQRTINLAIREVSGMISIHMDNRFTGELEYNEGMPVTTKEDKNEHGFGLRSIKHIVKKYGGQMTVSSSGGVFRLNITLPPSGGNVHA